MITRNLFIRLTNNKRKPWNKIELQKICKSLSLRTNLTNKEMYSNIKSFYDIKNKVLLHLAINLSSIYSRFPCS